VKRDYLETAKHYVSRRINRDFLQRTGIWQHTKPYAPSSYSPASPRSDFKNPPMPTTVEQPLALYVHIPFCTGKCTYCYFVTALEHTPFFQKEYVSALCTQIRKLGETMAKPSISSVYFGGGTPTCIPISLLVGTLEAIEESFVLRDGTEITIESSPEVTKEEVNYPFEG